MLIWKFFHILKSNYLDLLDLSGIMQRENNLIVNNIYSMIVFKNTNLKPYKFVCILLTILKSIRSTQQTMVMLVDGYWKEGDILLKLF